MTACDLPMASICPFKSALSSICFVISVAYFTTLHGFPFLPKIGLYARTYDAIGGLYPDFASALAKPLIFGSLKSAAF